jgi:hypothetical protein
MVVMGDGQGGDAESVAATDVGSWMAKADGGHLVPVLVQLAWEGSVDDARIEAMNESLAGRGFDTEVVVRVDRSRVDAVASAAVGQSATFAVVPAEPPGLDTAVFGAQEDRLVAQMPIPMVLAMLKRTPTRFVLALSERDQRRTSRNLQIVFEVAARLAKAGHPVSVYSASALSPEQLAHIGGAHAVHGDDDRAAYLKANIDEHTAVIVPAPGGASVFGHDIPSLAELGAGLLVAVGSGDDEADTVTIGHNLAAGRPRSA